MYAKSLALIVALAASPALAKTAPVAAPDHAGPIPYSELAAADAKMNAAPKSHMKKRVTHAKTAPATPAAAAQPASK
ncbi:MAG TPA: hypothetical protein VL358_08190 [Caulobacteraceae bacterium]|jgi:hypothetical protein|nr:hypothetical protein [Caulobacteraceae bacterium]